MNRRAFIQGLATATAVWTATAPAQAAPAVPVVPSRTPETQPLPAIKPRQNADGGYNVVFITTDQERYFPTPPPGTQFKARALLQELGVTFEKHYACSNMSTSSRSVMYTGEHIPHTGMLDNTDFPWQAPLSPHVTTLGHRLREAGCYTAYKGKWHMGKESIFDNKDKAAPQQQRELEAYGFSDWNAGGDSIGTAYQGYHQDDAIASEAIGWLRSRGTELNKEGRSFFLAVNFVNPHDIMYYHGGKGGLQTAKNLQFNGAPKHPLYATRYPDAPLPATWQQSMDKDRLAAHRVYHTLWKTLFGEMPARQEAWEGFRDYYYNCLQDNDQQLGRVLAEVTDLGLLDNTVLVFTSDHGEMQGAHGLHGKGGFLYEENIHVPMIIYHPRGKRGQRVASVSSHCDLVPTVLDACGAALPEQAPCRGYSLMDSVRQGTPTRRKEALFAFEMFSMLDGQFQRNARSGGFASALQKAGDKRGFVRGIITEEYKFARYFSPLHFQTPQSLDELYAHNDLELFDLKKDPHETTNLALRREAHGELVLQMNVRLNELIAREIGHDDGREVRALLERLQQNSLA